MSDSTFIQRIARWTVLPAAIGLGFGLSAFSAPAAEAATHYCNGSVRTFAAIRSTPDRCRSLNPTDPRRPPRAGDQCPLAHPRKASPYLGPEGQRARMASSSPSQGLSREARKPG